ncbi:LysR family transcriptional regulator [Lactococcus carnosus]|uniref:LysR family transcriptional regulator n=1 Tax=Pseudolactococcus carnosus TaxID=2749961 RepID=UPI001FBA9A61|nr:LysR family transcriptional regulator [Lactococcus carnosus]MCJ1973137.1 LysR family transcriptional regulator [Lactococcus carnosus]
MNLRDFEYFNALGELLSFTQVATQFNVSQPTISYAMKRLEQRYGCDLIQKDPSHRFVVLTREGEILKAHVTSILDELLVVDRAIEHAKQNKIHIGFPTLIRARIFSKLLREEGTVNLISNFNLISARSKDLLENLLSGQLDFSLMGSVTPLTHPSLTVELLYKREFFIFVSKDNPLSQKSEVSFADTLDYPFILLERGLAHTGAFQSLNDKYKNKAKVLLHFSDVHTIGQLVKSNIGITLMTDFLPFQDMDGLVKIPLVAEDKVPFYVQYAYLRNAVLDEKLQELIAMLDRLSKEDELV